MTTIVGYVRVSTDRQVEEGNGLAVQERAIRDWAATHGHHLLAIHRDEGVSGTKDTAERPGLAEAVAAVHDGQASALLVHRLDRLARTLTVQEAILSLVWRHGGQVFTADTGEVPQDDPTDPMRTFVRQVMGAAAQLERSMVVARMAQGRQHKADNGGYAFGAPPYGYRAEGRTLVPDEAEQEHLRAMRALRAEGATLRDIAQALNRDGVPTKRGGAWHSATVGKVLSRAKVQAA